jgi:MFS family permease
MEAIVDRQRRQRSVAKRTEAEESRTYVTQPGVLGLFKEAFFCDYEYLRQGGDMMKHNTMMRGTAASNISRYIIYTALKGFGFGLFLPIWVIYLQQQRGLSLSQAALVDVTFFVAAALAELPTGIVADRFGRTTSMTIGASLMTLGMIGWTFAPTLLLTIIAYVAMGVGMTFLSGAEDAFFYETVRATGRGDDYPRLLGRVSAIFPGALALGSVVSGFLAAINLILPFALSGVLLLAALGIVLTLREPHADQRQHAQARPSLWAVLAQSFAVMRDRPQLRLSMVYLAVVPLASFMIESVFVQPQALALGVPLAGIGVLVMAVQLTAMAGSAWSGRLTVRLGEGRTLFAAPIVICSSLLLLAALQVMPALVLIGVMGFATAVVRPILVSRMQQELSDNNRATMLSIQSLTFTMVAAMSQPTLGAVADSFGLPAAHVALAGAISIVMMVVFWKGYRHVRQAGKAMRASRLEALEVIVD